MELPRCDKCQNTRMINHPGIGVRTYCKTTNMDVTQSGFGHNSPRDCPKRPFEDTLTERGSSMKNIIISERIQTNDEPKVKLVNGSLLLHRNSSGTVIGAYLITSYRNNRKSSCDHWAETTGYCSFIDLDTGAIKFEEPASRTTTQARILRHLNSGIYKDGHLVSGYYHKGDGDYVDVYPNGGYRIELQVND